MSAAPSQADVRGAMQAGFSFVCSMCAHLHAGRTPLAEWAGTKCTGDGCSGPIGGQTYPKYEGPIKYALSSFCCFCGEPNPTHMASSSLPGNDTTRMIGVCDKHLHLVQNRMQYEAQDPAAKKTTSLNLFGHKVEL